MIIQDTFKEIVQPLPSKFSNLVLDVQIQDHYLIGLNNEHSNVAQDLNHMIDTQQCEMVKGLYIKHMHWFYLGSVLCPFFQKFPGLGTTR